MFTKEWFAHIQNDRYLKGTRELEGMVFHETVSNLMAFIEFLQTEQHPHIEHLEKHLPPFLKKLKHLTVTSLDHILLKGQLKELSYQDVIKNPAFNTYTKGIVDNINKLNANDPDNNSLLISGGWLNSIGGHAMLYEFKKDEQGDLLFLVYNSGAGLNFHHKVQGVDKERFCPICAYKIPKNSLHNDRLKWFIGELLIPNLALKKESPFSAELLYMEVFPKIAYLNGELIDPFPYIRPYNITAGQQSGTCAEKSLHQLLENEFPNKKTYQQFLYYFKKFALEGYFSKVETEQSIYEPGVLNQIQLAIENMSRLLLKADYFDESMRKAEADFLIPMQSKLEFYQKNKPALEEKPLELKIASSDLDHNRLMDLAYSKPAFSPEIKEELFSKTPWQPAQKVSINFQAEHLGIELSQFRKEIELLIIKDPHAALQSLEALFLEWPLPPNKQCKDIEQYIQHLSSVEAQRDFILNLVSLNQLYVEEYQKLHGSAIKPGFFVTQLSLLTISGQLYDQAFNPQLPFLNTLAMSLDHSLKTTRSNAALVSLDPIVDSRFTQIKNLLQPASLRKSELHWEASLTMKKAYDDLLKKHDLWDLFESYYEKYADIHKLSKNERVNDYKDQDVRPLFLMKTYIESSEIQKNQYIENISIYKEFNADQRQALIKKLDEAEAEFRFQHSFESMLRNIWTPMRSKPMEPIKKSIIELNNRGHDSTEPVLSPLVSALKRAELSNPKVWNLPEKSILDLLLKNNLLDENKIQLGEFLPKKTAKTKDIKWIRELLHLRSSTLMIPVSLNFFGHNLDLLEDPQKQLYLEKNLFDPLLLIDALDNEPELIKQIQDFLEFGIQAFTKAGQLKPPALAFMKLDVRLCLYSIQYYRAKLDQLEANTQEYQDLQTKIQGLNNNLLGQLERANRQAVLNADKPEYLYQFALQKTFILSFMMQDATTKKEKIALLQPLMSSLFALGFYEKKSSVENLLEKEQVEQGLRQLQLTYRSLAEDNQAEAEQLLIQSYKDSISALRSDFKKILQRKDTHFNIDMPFITLLDSKGIELLTSDCTTGRTSKPGLNRCYLPDDLKNQVWYQDLFKNYDPIARSNYDNTYFEFAHKDIHYRIIKVDRAYVLQKQIQIFNQEPSWFEAQAINKIKGLQQIFMEGSSMAWVKTSSLKQESEQVLITNKESGNIKYCYQRDTQQLIQMDEKGQDTGFKVLDSSSYLHQVVSTFEDPQFIIVLKGPEGYQIELPRYNLKLEVKEGVPGESPWHIFLAGTSYHLDLNEPNLFPGLKTPLLFKSGKDRKLFLPIQQFIAEEDLKPKKKASTMLAFATGYTGPGFFLPSAEPILEDPAHRFDKKTEQTSDSPTRSPTEPILEDPAHRFDKKIEQTSDSPTRSPTEPILEDPAHRFDKKIEQTSNSPTRSPTEPILEDPAHRFDKKIEQTSDSPPAIPSIEGAGVTELNLVPPAEEKKKPEKLPPVSLELKKQIPKHHSEYYNFTLNTRDYLRRDVVGNDALIYSYENSETAAEYVVLDKEIRPKTMKDGLYLAYTYLCCHQPEKAYSMLDYCEQYFHELSGTDQELDILKWIVFSIPAKLKNSTVEAKIERPEFVAVQLKAMYLLANFKNHNPDFTVLDKDKSPPNSIDKSYRNSLLQQRTQFYQHLSTNIYALYHKYHHIQANLPKQLKLKNTELLTLLRMVYADKKRQAKGPIGAQWRKLEAMDSQTELRNLEAKTKQFTQTVPKPLEDEIKGVRIKSTKYKVVGIERTLIKDSIIDIIIPKQFDWKFQNLSFKNISDLNNFYTATQDSLDQLVQLPIDEEKFILNFPQLCDRIYNNSLNKQDRERLLEFCEQTLRADYFSPSKNSNIPQLGKQLYVLIKYPDKVLERVKQKSADLFKKNRKSYDFPYAKNMKNIEVWMQQLSKLLSQLSIDSDLLIKESIHTVEGFKAEEKPLINLHTISEQLKETSKEPLSVPLEQIRETVFQLSEQKEVSSFQQEMAFLREQYGVKNRLCQKIPELTQFFENLEQLTKAYTQGVNVLKEEYAKANNIPSYIARTQITSDLDNQAGALANTLEQEKALASLKAFEHYSIRLSLLDTVTEAESLLETLCTTKLKHLEDFANQRFIPNPKSSEQVNLQLKLLGRSLKQLKLTDLLQLYLNNDLYETMNATGLSEPEVKELHNKITEYLAYSIQKQQYGRIGKIFKELGDDKSYINDQSSLFTQQTLTKLGQALNEENVLPFGQSPALTLFQYDQDILVREVQKQFIDSLLEPNPKTKEYSSKAIQLIMGGGKSKVLLPILALKKADGENLSIIEVPQALYRTNLSDLNQISLRLFGQKALGFNFNRQSACDSITLKKLFRELKHTSITKGYVVTTKESMASLELKYHELLSNPPKVNKAEWKKQIKWLDRIINLRKTRGDLLIDEIDSSLLIRKQINYTVGKKNQVPVHHVNAVVDLYKFLNSIQYQNSNVLDLLLKTDSLSKDLLSQILDHTARQLVSNEQSPLYPFLYHPISDAETQHIRDYLLNECKTYPKSMLQQKSNARGFAFKFLKAELSHFLPHSFSLKLHTNYGPSQNPEKSVLERLITIPYAGNNDPQERSKDTLHIKTLNLTIQSTLEQGLTAEIVEFILNDIINNARKELLNNPKLGSIDHTSYGKTINEAFTKAGVQQLISKWHLNDEEQISSLVKKLSNNRAFIFYALEEHVLPKVEIDTKILVHNPLNHINMYRSAQGVTGTPFNWRTMHEKIQFDELLSLGIDGLTIARLKKVLIAPESKEESFETRVLVEDYLNPQQFIEQAVKKIPNPESFRALIDIGATFRGISNHELALTLANYATEFNATYKTSILYVLYFDKDNISNMDELYAIPIDNPKAAPISLKGKTAKDIATLLQCSEDNYFTYYDQKHTVGSDIKQALSAQALVTVDSKTLKKDLCQGVMRMRGFGNGQKVSLVLSNDTCNALNLDKHKINIEHVLQLTENNQQEMLLQDHFTAALQMIESCIVNDLNSRILALDEKDADKKAEMYQHFEGFFTQSISELFIDLYGSIEQEHSTEEIFNLHIKSLTKGWKKVLTKAHCAPNVTELEAMKEHLQHIKQNALRNCDKAYLKTAQDQDQSSESQKEMHNQPEQDQNKDLEVDESFYETSHSHTDPLYWNKNLHLNDFFNLQNEDLFETPYSGLMAKKTSAMPQMLQFPQEYFEEKQMPYVSSGFDETIRQSYNVRTTTHHDRGDHIAEDQQKQIHTMLMIQKGSELKCILMTFKEAEHMKELLKKEKPEAPNFIWLTNTQGFLYAGVKPDKEQLHKNYDRIMQQLQFYNGELNILKEVDLIGTWLMEEAEEKLNFFEQNLLAFRMTHKNDFSKLRKKTQSLSKVVQEALNTLDKPFQALDHASPLISKTDIQRVAAFHEFCNALLAGEIGSIPEEFAKPYYFKLIFKAKNDRLFNDYCSLLNPSLLQNYLVKSIELLEKSHDIKRMCELFERQPFTDGVNKMHLFEAFNQSLNRKSFIKSILTKSSNEELKYLVQHLSPPLKQKLLLSMSSEQLTKFMAKDLVLIQNFFADIVLEDPAPNLGTLGVVVKESKCHEIEYSYNYLLTDPDKLNVVKHHASKEYLKNFWLLEQRTSSPICKLLELLCTQQNNQTYLKQFDEAYELFLDSSEQVDQILWLTALKLVKSNPNCTINPLLFLNNKLSLTSYFNTLNKNPNHFIASCLQKGNHHSANFFYHQLLQLNSEEQTTELLRSKLKIQNGPDYGKSLIEMMATLEDKPETFEPLLVMDAQAQLIFETKKLLSHERFNNVSSALRLYSTEFMKRPSLITPLTQLCFKDRNGASKLIVDVIRELGSSYDKKALDEALQNEQSTTSKPRTYDPSFFKDVVAEEIVNIKNKMGPSI